MIKSNTPVFFSLLFLLGFLFSKNAFGQAEVYTDKEQSDSTYTIQESDKIEVPEEKKPHSPKKAVLLSAALPGLGQIYNKKYWKLPIIYAGFGGLGYSIFANTRNWKTYRNAYKLRVDEDPSTVDEFDGRVSENNLLDLKNYYKRNLDLSVIFTVVLYALNLVDAAVDAHLFYYNVSDDLSMHVRPVLEFNAQTGSNTAGMTIIFGL